MVSYIIRRLLWAVVLLFAITFITFIIFYLMPAADPAVLRAGKNGTPESIQHIRETLGLDQPWYVQYWDFVSKFITKFDLGESFITMQNVKEQLIATVPATASLALGAAVVWLVVGISLGTIAAVKRGTWIDKLAMGGALIAISAPVYWLGLVSTYLFSEEIGKLFPLFAKTGSYTAITTNPLEWANALLLPWLVLATAFSAIYARFVRSSLSEVLSEDYIRTAKAKGLSSKRVIYRHGLRSAMTPVVTIFGMDIGILMGGAILTETIFNIPGVGRYAYQAVSSFDIPAIQGVVLVMALSIVIASLLVDIAYAVIDPRVRYT